jgi:hypothetical protein
MVEAVKVEENGQRGRMGRAKRQWWSIDGKNQVGELKLLCLKHATSTKYDW